MNNTTKTVILFIILGVMAMLISWCAVQSQVVKQVELSEKEIAKQEAIIENAKQELAKNKKIAEAGKAYIKALEWNIPKEEKTAEIKQEPTVAPSFWYICLVDDKWSTEYREYKDDEVTYLKDCNAFLSKSECWISNSDWANCLKKE